MAVIFKEAKWIYKRFLETFGYAAIVNPFSRTCHVLKAYCPPGLKLRAHETAHIDQIAKEGAIKFSFKYLWYLIKYGYEQNPYEIEARAAEEEALRNSIR